MLLPSPMTGWGIGMTGWRGRGDAEGRAGLGRCSSTDAGSGRAGARYEAEPGEDPANVDGGVADEGEADDPVRLRRRRWRRSPPAGIPAARSVRTSIPDGGGGVGLGDGSDLEEGIGADGFEAVDAGDVEGCGLLVVADLDAERGSRDPVLPHRVDQRLGHGPELGRGVGGEGGRQGERGGRGSRGGLLGGQPGRARRDHCRRAPGEGRQAAARQVAVDRVGGRFESAWQMVHAHVLQSSGGAQARTVRCRRFTPGHAFAAGVAPLP